MYSVYSSAWFIGSLSLIFAIMLTIDDLNTSQSVDLASPALRPPATIFQWLSLSGFLRLAHEARSGP